MSQREEHTPHLKSESGSAGASASGSGANNVRSISADPLVEVTLAAAAGKNTPQVEESSETLPAWLEERSATPAIKTIVFLNIAIYAAMLAVSLADLVSTTGANPVSLLIAFPTETLINWGANSAPATVIDHQYWRLLTNTFIHANALHLAMNMYVLFDFTRLSERLYGSIKFLTIYFCAAIGSSICSLLFINADNISAGASGAIFGAFGAAVAYFWVFRKDFPKKFFRMYSKMFFVFVIYFIVSAIIFPGMDNAAHLGGFIVGLWTALCLLPQQAGEKQWRSRNFLQLSCLVVVLIIGMFLDARMNEHNPQVVGQSTYSQAIKLLKQERFAEAMSKLDRAAKLLPNNASIYADAACAEEKLDSYELAVSFASRALKLDPKSKNALRARALSLHNLGDERRSIEDYNRLIQLDRNNPVVLNNRAWCYNASNLPDKALADANRALEMDPRCASAYDTRAVAYILLGKLAEASADCEKYIALKADDGAIYYHRAIARYKLGNSAAARADLEKAKKLSYKPEAWEQKLLLEQLKP